MRINCHLGDIGHHRIMTKTVTILNGPNLNLLGTREPEIYGSETLADIEKMCAEKASALGLSSDFKQSNIEGELVTWIQEARANSVGIIINAAAYTHTSVAILDALNTCDCPIIEVHLSNIHQRESFRHKSYVSRAADGMICGLGSIGYTLALDAISAQIARGD
jgi:3-dehydroquinate dehydratase-2